MNFSTQYLNKCADIISVIRSQQDKIDLAAQWFCDSIAKGRVVHLFVPATQPHHGGRNGLIRIISWIQSDCRIIHDIS